MHNTIMNLWVVKKFWARVEQHLLEKKNLFFENNSICIQFDNNTKICLNVNGQGFVIRDDCFPKKFNGKVYIPEHILNIVEGVYGNRFAANFK